jgi:dihydroneopterin aldolase/D-erythro-7,8-dihydroneopterin triphosphate epimerase
MTTAHDPIDEVFIKDLAVQGIIGINPSERVTPQEILVNAVLSVDTRAAAASDDIEDAVNYRTIAKQMIAHIEGGEPLLVERLVQELADICLADQRVQRVTVSVEKPGAVRFSKSVGIKITRSRFE